MPCESNVSGSKFALGAKTWGKILEWNGRNTDYTPQASGGSNSTPWEGGAEVKIWGVFTPCCLKAGWQKSGRYGTLLLNFSNSILMRSLDTFYYCNSTLSQSKNIRDKQKSRIQTRVGETSGIALAKGIWGRMCFLFKSSKCPALKRSVLWYGAHSQPRDKRTGHVDLDSYHWSAGKVHIFSHQKANIKG